MADGTAATTAEQRYSPLTQITAANVSRLGLAWSYEVGTGGGPQEATPLMANGVLYGITNWSIVFAVDARTGQGALALRPEGRSLDRRSRQRSGSAAASTAAASRCTKAR